MVDAEFDASRCAFGVEHPRVPLREPAWVSDIDILRSFGVFTTSWERKDEAETQHIDKKYNKDSTFFQYLSVATYYSLQIAWFRASTVYSNRIVILLIAPDNTGPRDEKVRHCIDLQ